MNCFRRAWYSVRLAMVAIAILLVNVQEVLGQEGEGEGERTYGWSWGLTLLCLVLGLLVTLRPSHRAEEIKRAVREDD